MLSSSSFSHGLRFCVTKTSYTMDGFYNLYLPTILLMRSGDIETNPGPNTPESTVSEEELILLSEQIDCSKYIRLGNRLGISYTVLSGIKRRSDDDSDAFMQVFMKWRKKKRPGTDTRAILALELQTCGLDELSGRLLDGSLLSNTTSKASVPSTSPPSPPHQPLSPELIEKCAEDFKFKYRNTLCKIRADPLNPDSLVQFEDMYTNLVLEEEHGRYKRLLEYSDLVKLKDEAKFSRRLLVQGEAGAGKTTFCAKIAWDWINGRHFQEFKWVIIVPLREAKKYTIGEIAKSYLTSNNPTTASQLTEYMHLNTDKVFIVFDGLDEFYGDGAQPEDWSQTTGYESKSLQSSQARGQSSRTSGSTQPQAKLQSASSQKKVSSAEKGIRVEEILRSEKLETVPVMVTTRPWKAIKIRRNDRLRKNYTFLYVEGFSKQNVAAYIKKYFAGNEAKAESLIQFANDNDVISENMAPYPIYIAMLCLMWREFDEEKQKMMKALQTFSQIFDEIFVFLKEHYALKMANPSCSLDESLNDCLKDVNKLLEPIASLALNGLLKNTLVFGEGDFGHCQDSMKTACRVGVLSEESKIILGKGRRDASNPRMKPTVFFPHRLFQEFMAGIHLASLYKTDNGEYNRLMETVTGRRKEEFRYLLYFTASQNQTVGIDVLTHIERSIRSERDKRFLVDVAFECHDTHAADVIKDKVSPQDATLVLQDGMTAHTVAGYAFIKTDMASLTVQRECGPTMSREVAEMICSVPSLREVALHKKLHDNFFTTIAAQGQFSKIQCLTIRLDVQPVSASTSHDLIVALSSMPNLTELTLVGVSHLYNEFFSKWKSMASFMKIQSLTISYMYDMSPVCASASHDLAVALCSMPNLTELTLNGVTHLQDEFVSKWKSMASSMKIQSLTISCMHGMSPVCASASHDLAVALCSMPNLTELTLNGVTHLQDEFVSKWKSMASSMKIQSLTISCMHVMSPVSASASHDLAVALSSLPNLTELTLDGVGNLQDEFVSKWKSMASSMTIQSLTIGFDGYRVSASASHDLAVAYSSMPNLTGLTLDRVHLHDECFSKWKSMASSMKIQSLTIGFAGYLVSASALHDLVVALSSMPNLTELTLDDETRFPDEFISTLEAMAASMKDCFPQITKGNFLFNRTRHESLESFMRELSNLRRQCVMEEAYEAAPAAPTVDHYGHHSTPEDPTPILTHPRATAVCEPTRTEDFSHIQEEGNPEEDENGFPLSPPVYPHHGLADPELQHPAPSPAVESHVHHSAPEGPTTILTHPRVTDVCEPTRTENFSHVQEAGNPQQAITDHQGWNPAPFPAVDHYGHHSTPEGPTPILTHPRVTDVCEPMRTKEISFVQEAGNQAGMSDDRRCTNLSDPSESQEYFQPSSLPAQTGDRPESPQTTHPISSPFQVPQSTVGLQHSHTHPLPHQGPDSNANMLTFAHQHSQPDDKFVSLPTTYTARSKDTVLGQASDVHNRSDNALQLPQTVGSSSGRPQSLKRTGPYTQSRVPQDVPEKQPRVGILQESPSVHLCDYSSSDESSTSEEANI